jgi:hypothetical protein
VRVIASVVSPSKGSLFRAGRGVGKDDVDMLRGFAVGAICGFLAQKMEASALAKSDRIFDCVRKNNALIMVGSEIFGLIQLHCANTGGALFLLGGTIINFLVIFGVLTISGKFRRCVVC